VTFKSSISTCKRLRGPRRKIHSCAPSGMGRPKQGNCHLDIVIADIVPRAENDCVTFCGKQTLVEFTVCGIIWCRGGGSGGGVGPYSDALSSWLSPQAANTTTACLYSGARLENAEAYFWWTAKPINSFVSAGKLLRNCWL